MLRILVLQSVFEFDRPLILILRTLFAPDSTTRHIPVSPRKERIQSMYVCVEFNATGMQPKDHGVSVA